MPSDAPRTKERVLVQVRLSKELVRTIDHLCVDRDLFRQDMVERLLHAGLMSMEVQQPLPI